MSYEVALTLAGWFGGRVHHAGGWHYLAVCPLSGGRVVVISSEMICEYESFDHFQAGSTPIRRIDWGTRIHV